MSFVRYGFTTRFRHKVNNIKFLFYFIYIFYIYIFIISFLLLLLKFSNGPTTFSQRYTGTVSAFPEKWQKPTFRVEPNAQGRVFKEIVKGKELFFSSSIVLPISLGRPTEFSMPPGNEGKTDGPNNNNTGGKTTFKTHMFKPPRTVVMVTAAPVLSIRPLCRIVNVPAGFYASVRALCGHVSAVFYGFVVMTPGDSSGGGGGMNKLFVVILVSKTWKRLMAVGSPIPSPTM